MMKFRFINKKQLLFIIIINILLLLLEIYFYSINDSLNMLYYRKGLFKLSVYVFSLIFTNTFVASFILVKNSKLFLTIAVVTIIPMLFDLTYYFTTGSGFGFNELSVAINEIYFIDSAINTFFNSIIKALFITILMFVALIFFRKKIIRVINPLSKKVLLILFIGSVFSSYSIMMRTSGSLYIPITYIKVYNNLFYFYKNSLYSGKRDKVAIYPNSKTKYRNIIFILDESVGGKYLSLNNFSKKTTPFLDSIEGTLLKNLGLAVSGTNCSGSSNIILMSGANSSKIPDKLGITMLKQPNIFQYMKKAGYKTAYISGQSKNELLQNFMRKEDLNYVDFFYQPYESHERSMLPLIPENNLIKNINLFLNENKDSLHFVFVVKSGSHFPYESSYPIEYKKFEPTLKIAENIDLSKIDLMTNSYLNSLQYGVDYFFKYFLNSISLEETVIIYTSDHGQSLLENNIISTHCTARNTPLSQGIVPMFIIHQKGDITFEKLPKDIYSHFNLFPTFLELAGYNIGDDFDESIFKIKEPIDYFYSGEIFGRSSNFSKNKIKTMD